MFKNKSAREVKVNERIYQLICDSESPLTELIEVLKKLADEVQCMLEEVLKSQQAQVPEVIQEGEIQNG